MADIAALEKYFAPPKGIGTPLKVTGVGIAIFLIGCVGAGAAFILIGLVVIAAGAAVGALAVAVSARPDRREASGAAERVAVDAGWDD